MLGEILSIGLKFSAKLGVSSGSLWFIGLSVGLKLLDLFINWRNQDTETKRKYIELVTAMQNHSLVSVKLKKQAEEMREALDKLDEPKNETPKV